MQMLLDLVQKDAPLVLQLELECLCRSGQAGRGERVRLVSGRGHALHKSFSLLLRMRKSYYALPSSWPEAEERWA